MLTVSSTWLSASVMAHTMLVRERWREREREKGRDLSRQREAERRREKREGNDAYPVDCGLEGYGLSALGEPQCADRLLHLAVGQRDGAHDAGAGVAAERSLEEPREVGVTEGNVRAVCERGGMQEGGKGEKWVSTGQQSHLK